MAQRRNAVLVACVALAVGAAYGLHRYSYPKLSDDARLSGLVEVRREWWRRRTVVRFDRNRDGRADFTGVWPGGTGTFFTHQMPDEAWEDNDLDGLFEVHVRFSAGEARYLEIDTDRDGRVDVTLQGEDAKARYRLVR